MAKLLSEAEIEEEMRELLSDISQPSSSPPVVGPTARSLHVLSAPPVAASSSSSSSSIAQALPVRPPAPGAANATPWLLNPGGISNSTTTASTSSQFTFATSGVPFPPPPPSSSASMAPAPSPYFPAPIQLPQSQSALYQQQPYLQYSSFQPQPAIAKAPQYTYQGVFQAPISTPQQQQAQQLFQKDAQTITPEALESVKAALASGDNEHKAEAKKRAVPRKAAGQSWEDPTLADWPENDYRLFCGDLGNEVNDEVLTKAFSRFATFNMARVVRDKRTGKTKGYGFVSFSTPSDLALALKEMNGKYVGNRPIKLRKSNWKDRTDAEALDRHKSNKRVKTWKKNVLHK